jgi:GNAT superfamily N-acetyltransferase
VEFFARDAIGSDYDAFRELLPELRATVPVPTREQFLALVAPGAFFVVHAGALRAYGFLRTYEETAHLVHVVVAPGSRRIGLGQAVMREAARRARHAGCVTWYLNVNKDNATAIALYERCGLRMLFESVLFELGWADVARLPAGTARPADQVPPERDRAIEEAFALPHGLLAGFRTPPARLMRVIYEGTTPVAFAALNHEFSEAGSFRVRHPHHARGLFESFRELVPPGQTLVRVFAEGDAALADALLRAGGTEKLRTLRMAGEIEG